jgi:hypothetical protein
VELFEGKGAFVKLSVFDSAVKNPVNQFFYCWLADFLKRATCRFYCISKEYDGTLLESRLRPIITIGRFVDGVIGGGILVLRWGSILFDRFLLFGLMVKIFN